MIGWDLLRFFRPNSPDIASLKITRIAVLLLGAAALALALHKASVYDLIIDSWSVLLASLFVPLTALESRAELRAPINKTKAASGRYSSANAIMIRSGLARSGRITAPARPSKTGNRPMVI